MGKPRVNLRLSHKLHAELERRTAASSVTKTEIVEEALSRFLTLKPTLSLSSASCVGWMRLMSAKARLNGIQRSASKLSHISFLLADPHRAYSRR